MEKFARIVVGYHRCQRSFANGILLGKTPFTACFDLLDEKITSLLAMSYRQFSLSFANAGEPLPINKGNDQKLRELDCAVINYRLNRVASGEVPFDTVRGAFLEGTPIFPGTTISAETHIQIAVRDADCILGVLRPN